MFPYLLIVRTLLGAIYLIFGLNGFFLFIPVPPMTEQATALILALKKSGVLYMEKSIEVLAGLMLLSNQYSKLATILLAPLSINILFFHLFLDQGILLFAIVLFLMNVYLAWQYRLAYYPILEK